MPDDAPGHLNMVEPGDGAGTARLDQDRAAITEAGMKARGVFATWTDGIQSMDTACVCPEPLAPALLMAAISRAWLVLRNLGANDDDLYRAVVALVDKET